MIFSGFSAVASRNKSNIPDLHNVIQPVKLNEDDRKRGKIKCLHSSVEIRKIGYIFLSVMRRDKIEGRYYICHLLAIIIIIIFYYDLLNKKALVRCTILDAWGWCTGTTQRKGMGREEGGGFRMRSTGIPVVDSFRCLAKLIQSCKV